MTEKREPRLREVSAQPVRALSLGPNETERTQIPQEQGRAAARLGRSGTQGLPIAMSPGQDPSSLYWGTTRLKVKVFTLSPQSC